MPRPLLLVAGLVLGLAPASFAGVSGAYRVSGRDRAGLYWGDAALVEAADGRVEGREALQRARWSTSRGTYVYAGSSWAVLRGRVVGGALVGARLGPAGSLRVRFTIGATSIGGAYDGGRAIERLTPVGDPLLERLRDAAKDIIHVSETDAPYEAFALAGSFTTPEEFRALAGHAADRPVRERTLDAWISWRDDHQPGESAEDAAIVDRYQRLVRVLRAELTDIRVIRIGGPNAFDDGDDILGQLHVYIVGRTPQGGLAGVKTISVET
jgi:hypothetical protein